MVTGWVIRKNEYHDSVFLMRVAKRLSDREGILQAAILMGTEKNKGLLVEIGVSGAEISNATPNDLILAVKAESEQALTNVLATIDQWLSPDAGRAGKFNIRTLDEAMVRQPHSNLAVISVPGAYAAREAQKALECGLNVFLFSDNVPVENERSLKEFARKHGLIVMGPDCGTAIIGGVGVGFANVVRRGPIGVIGTSGTGIQEFTTLVHRAGSGISHAIGTGSRDLSDEIGGISMLSALDALDVDMPTKAIAIISKPPDPTALAYLVPRILQCHKPVVVCFLGLKKEPPHANIRYQTAHTLDEAAALAVQIATGNPPSRFRTDDSQFQALISKERAVMKPGQKYLRGIFAGGTFCYQAQQVLQEAGLVVYSNAPLQGTFKLPDPLQSKDHTLVDMGADEFTAGRPHPMIDARLRRERLLAEGQDPQVAILLLDFILGFNSSSDPAGELVASITEAKAKAKERRGFLSVVASVCGTEEDPQNFAGQVRKLQEAGAVVFPSSAQAAHFCTVLLRSLPEAPHDR
ncbi:MAG: acyl-CoA synthetase FdrA [Deltaproteobacteria bacterium]|nr:acyl-CoA synthetase FdrA [Deltaproteobacteria bacterium]